jgi:hypothetical protein
MEEMIIETHEVTPAQWTFLKKHDIGLSNAYIGMLRAYYQNRTIWQTSWTAPFLAPHNEYGGIDFGPIDAELKRQVHEWLGWLMGLSDTERDAYLKETNLHLYRGQIS